MASGDHGRRLVNHPLLATLTLLVVRWQSSSEQMGCDDGEDDDTDDYGVNIGIHTEDILSHKVVVGVWDDKDVTRQTTTTRTQPFSSPPLSPLGCFLQILATLTKRTIL